VKLGESENLGECKNVSGTKRGQVELFKNEIRKIIDEFCF